MLLRGVVQVDDSRFVLSLPSFAEVVADFDDYSCVLSSVCLCQCSHSTGGIPHWITAKPTVVSYMY